MFYLMMHSTHFIYGFMESDIIMVKDHSESERGNLLLPHGLLFPINTIPQTTAFVTPVVEHWLQRENKKKKLMTPNIKTHWLFVMYKFKYVCYNLVQRFQRHADYS